MFAWWSPMILTSKSPPERIRVKADTTELLVLTSWSAVCRNASSPQVRKGTFESWETWVSARIQQGCSFETDLTKLGSCTTNLSANESSTDSILCESKKQCHLFGWQAFREQTTSSVNWQEAISVTLLYRFYGWNLHLFRSGRASS